MTSPYAPLELINAQKMFDRIESRIQVLEAAAVALKQARVVYRDTATTGIAASTPVTIASWNLAGRNDGNVGYANGIFTINVPGLYKALFSCRWPGTTGAHTRQMGIYKNGADPTYEEGKLMLSYFGDVATSKTLFTTGDFELVAGDTLQAYVVQSTSGSITVNPRQFAVVRIE